MTRDEFRAMYVEELTRAIAEHPDEYPWAKAPTVIVGNLGTTTLPRKSVDEVVDGMLAAMRRGSYSKDGRAIKSMCKRLGVKYTYKGLQPIIREALGW